MADVTKDVFVKIVKKASKEGVKSGLIATELPSNVADGLADQYAVAYELVAKGSKITPEKLAIVLLEKGIGIAKMGSSAQRYQCGLAVAVVGIGFFKSARSAAAAAASNGALTPLFVCDAVELIEKVYKMDQKCGISEAVYAEAIEQVTPAYMWFHNGIVDWIGSQAVALPR